MTFGLVGDIIFGLAVVLVVGSWLDHRKQDRLRRRKP